jgi:hypothetical protein
METYGETSGGQAQQFRSNVFHETRDASVGVGVARTVGSTQFV